MILLLRNEASEGEIADLRKRLDELGFESTRLDDVRGRAFEAHGPHIHDLIALRDHPAVADMLAEETRDEAEESLWPHGVLQIFILFVLLLVVLLVLIALFPAGLSDRADLGAPAPGGASEWYLRPLAAFLRTFGAPFGGFAVLLLWIGFLAWPFLDRRREPGPRARRIALLVRIMGSLLIVLMLLFALLPLP